MVPIIKDPDKRLHEVSKEVDDFQLASRIAKELIEVTEKVDRPWKMWLGMAAPQIGYSRRILILKKSFKNYLVLVNPKILEQKWLLPVITRCYSLKGFYLSKYHFFFKLKYQDLKENYHEEIIRAGRAATLQQEIDHLDGILVSEKGIRLF